MQRSTIRLIALREIRDLLRDRRTLLIVLGLPALLYPAFVVVGLAWKLDMVITAVVMSKRPICTAHCRAPIMDWSSAKRN